MILGAQPFEENTGKIRSRDYHLIVFEHPKLAKTERRQFLRASRVALASDTEVLAAAPGAPFELFLLRLLKRALPKMPPDAVAELDGLARQVALLQAKEFAFQYRDPLTQELLGKFLQVFNRLLKGRLLSITISDIANLEVFSFLLIRKIIDEKCAFNHLFIFDFTPPRKRGAAQRTRTTAYVRSLFHILEICVMLKLWNRAYIIIETLFTLLRSVSDRKLLGLIYFRAGMIYARKGLLDRTLRCYQHSLDIFEKTEDPANQIKALNNLGNIYSDLARYPEASQLFQRALGLAEELQSDYSLGVIYSSLGNVNLRLGRYSDAIDELQKALIFTLRSGYFSRVQIVYCYLGDAWTAVKDKARALRYYQAADRAAALEDIRIDRAMVKMRIGAFWLGEKEFVRSRESFKIAEGIYRNYNNRYGLMLVAEQYGNLARAMKQYELARRCYREGRALAKTFHKADLAAELAEKIKTVEFYLRERRAS